MARRLLTNRRAAWIASRQHTGTMRGMRLALPAGVAMRYAAHLTALSAAMTADTRKQIDALFRHDDVADYFVRFHAVADAVSPASQARIITNQLKTKWEQIFGSRAKPLAETMVGQSDAASTTAVHASLRELSGGLSMKTDFITGPMEEVLKGTIAENVSLIKSIPSEYFTKVQGEVLRSITSGRGLEDLEPWFAEQEGITERRAKNIALDQTHKAYNGFNKGRMQGVGVKSFEWVHSGGGLHPRQRHIDLSGKVFRFDALPVIDDDGTRGIPGQAINCRCTMVPVMKFEEGEAA